MTAGRASRVTGKTKATRPLSIANLHPGLRIDRRAISSVIATLDAHADEFRSGCPPGELSLVFLTDAALAKLHADFLDDPTITDVITFEGNAGEGIMGAEAVAGEICVSADAARRQTTLPSSGSTGVSANATTAAFSDELTLYLVHGWLHLAGYDDLVPAKKQIMRRAERRALELLRARGALPRFKLTSGNVVRTPKKIRARSHRTV